MSHSTYRILLTTCLRAHFVSGWLVVRRKTLNYGNWFSKVLFTRPNFLCQISRVKCVLNVNLSKLPIVRSLSGKNLQDLYKVDKVSISFPATPKSN